MKTFTQYMKEVHSNGYMGTDDEMSDAFEKWLADFSIDEWIENAQRYGFYLLDECKTIIN